MAKIDKKNSAFTVKFSDEEASALGIQPDTEFELIEAKKGIWLMTELEENEVSAEKEKAPEINQSTAVKPGTLDEKEQKIIGLIKKLDLKDLVEGVFEQKLNNEEKEKLKKMIEEKKIVKFKLNESYKKPIYRLAEVQPITFENNEKEIGEFTLEKDGFLVVKNEMRAKMLSEELKERIKNGEIKGTRAFSGEFYIILSELLDNARERVIKEIKKTGKDTIEALSEKAGLTQTLVKIAMEFLKEEGQIIEKKKGEYQYIE